MPFFGLFADERGFSVAGFLAAELEHFSHKAEKAPGVSSTPGCDSPHLGQFILLILSALWGLRYAAAEPPLFSRKSLWERE